MKITVKRLKALIKEASTYPGFDTNFPPKVLAKEDMISLADSIRSGEVDAESVIDKLVGQRGNGARIQCRPELWNDKKKDFEEMNAIAKVESAHFDEKTQKLVVIALVVNTSLQLLQSPGRTRITLTY